MSIVKKNTGPLSSDFPQNPLKEKWGKLYPPIPMPQYSQVCDGYSCMYCGRCPSGANWEVPKEDEKVWEQYQEQLREYDKNCILSF